MKNKKRFLNSYLSPAKINLFFHVLFKRKDGYHEIASFFQMINLFDRISISFSNKDKFFSSSRQISLDHSNLVIQALHLFRKKTGLFKPVEIFLEKNIPLQAGLGGGSSNAATTLYALNELFNAPLSLEECKELALILGSDVPFFLSSGSAFVQGRGEIIKPVNLKKTFSGYLFKPSFGLSTKEVYAHFKKSTRRNIPSLTEENIVLFNDLEEAAFQLNPLMKKIKTDLLDLFEKVVMTGSGSTFVCLNPKKEISHLKLIPFTTIKNLR